MIIDRHCTVDLKVTFKVDHSYCRIGGLLTKGEWLIFAVLLYALKGDLSNAVGVLYGDLKRFKRYKLDVTSPEFHAVCKVLSYRRGWVEDRLSMISMLWFEQYQRHRQYAVFKFDSNVARVVNVKNYKELVKRILKLL